MHNIIFIDTEIGTEDKRIHDIGAVRENDVIFHSNDICGFVDFVSDAEFLCGHNIIHHDLKYLSPALDGRITAQFVDTLYLSPLLFPKRPYHALLKDDKLQTDELNNPVNDSRKAQILFWDEVNAFDILPDNLKRIFYELLHNSPEFKGFFAYINYNPVPKGFMDIIRNVGLTISIIGGLSPE